MLLSGRYYLHKLINKAIQNEYHFISQDKLQVDHISTIIDPFFGIRNVCNVYAYRQII